ncbi:hypothetical protein SADUNF_Sadunf07G0043600 [Salix dunnii]|uniref:CBS domain-containing protein n=1 Tax=Salix dunnii TaxID=1413687 RepID=A0A835JZS9_9ROSI|nr:hypothetical protein SADUNF_Sadunf07G0043600 [Salix dunnii]
MTIYGRFNLVLIQLRLFRTFKCDMKVILLPYKIVFLSLADVQPKNGVYTVGDFMTRKEDLHVVKPTTTVDEALEALVENRITGFPVIDDDWKLVGLVSDYDLLALDSISGGGRTETNMFPEVDSTWKIARDTRMIVLTGAPLTGESFENLFFWTFNEVQRLLSKNNGKVVGDLMTQAPVVVRETTNLEDAARLLLETKYRRLPVVDADGKLGTFYAWKYLKLITVLITSSGDLTGHGSSQVAKPIKSAPLSLSSRTGMIAITLL